MKKLILIAVVGSLSLLYSPHSSIYAAAGKNSGSNGRKIIFNETDLQIQKTRRNLMDKIDGSIEAISNRIAYLKQNITRRRTSKFGMSEDELKSMALSIKSDIDKAKEDVTNYMMNGDLFLSERDRFFQKIDGLKKQLADLRVVSAEDLDKG